MGKLVNRAKMTVASAPGTGAVTLGSAVSGYQSFAAAGVIDQDVVSYVIEDGTNWEFGQGTYTASGTSLARTTIGGSNNSGAAINATTGAQVYITALAQDVLPSPLRNRLINGDIRLDQRNLGAAVTYVAGAALAYGVDRWYAYSTGANVSGQRVAGTGNVQYRYQFTGAASVTAIGFGQRIETLNSYDLAGTTCTLAVDLANSVLTTVTWTAYYATTSNTFGTLASPTKTQIATGTFTVGATVARYVTQIAIPLAAVTGVEILFTVGAQTSGTWTIGNVQLETGANATTYEKRHITIEAELCQRYFQWIQVNAYFYAGTAGIAMQTQVCFPTTMFATPTVGATVADPAQTPSSSNQSANGMSSVTANGGVVQITAPSAGASYIFGYRCSLTAEL